jgi:hypothetical protein
VERLPTKSSRTGLHVDNLPPPTPSPNSSMCSTTSTGSSLRAECHNKHDNNDIHYIKDNNDNNINNSKD